MRIYVGREEARRCCELDLPQGGLFRWPSGVGVENRFKGVSH